MAKKLPKEILVYQCDEADGEPVYAVARNVNEIPEDYDGAEVSVYTINRSYKFGVTRTLK
ncbi:hypothetical protein [Rhodoplanes sp. Z2-YC6860]|uniref:hypothetical protein n=1 Tax=Rhodoplanes sp. Z2-YC6860 TaxID=674703 RepID=UPI000833B069|nr:hypothetical protein [Rhodoplanes sp. Z2-YC6860]